MARVRGFCMVLALFVLASGASPLGFAAQHPRADIAEAVTIRRGGLYVDGRPFTIKGMNYNPTAIGSDVADPSAPSFDVPNIAALGANTIGTYDLGRTEWGRFTEVTNGERFYDALYPVAEANDLRIVVAYFSNNTIDWTDGARVARITAQFQRLVAKARNRRSTLMYLIGNEVFEKLVDDAQRRAYAGWIGEMVAWTHRIDPNHPVVYADSHGLPAERWLRAYAPDLDVYGINSYAFSSTESLARIVAGYLQAWPGKPILLHEWGTDSWSAEKGATDEDAQSARVTELAAAINTVHGDAAHPLIGSLYFAYSDEWRFVGPWASQDRDAGWSCGACFDGRADEDYWGLARAVVARGAGGRTVKAAYRALRRAWERP